MKKIILDTDIGNDCDDAGALALLHNMESEGICEIKAITSCTSRRDGVACVDAINKYYNRQIPVGQFLKKGFLVDGYGDYSISVSKQYKNDYLYKDAEDATKVLIRELMKQDDKSITLVLIGPLNNFSDLLKYKGEVNGLDLINEKVSQVVVMGGVFKEFSEEIFFAGSIMKAEWNIVQDIEAARDVVRLCPVDMVFCPFEIGLIKTGSKLFENNYNSPIRLSYEVHNGGIRESWDPVTCYFAVKGESGLWSLSNNGKIIVNEEGITTFLEDEDGKHRVLRKKASDEKIRKEIDSWIF